MEFLNFYYFKWLGLMLGQSLATGRGSLTLKKWNSLKVEIFQIPFMSWLYRSIKNAMQKIHIENFDHLASRPSQSLLLLFSTEFTVSNHQVVIPNQAATSIYSEVRAICYIIHVELEYYALFCNCKGYTFVLHCRPGGTIWKLVGTSLYGGQNPPPLPQCFHMEVKVAFFNAISQSCN